MGQLLAEAQDLARLTASAYDTAMRYYREEYKVSPADADALAVDRPPLALEGIPSYEIRWMALNSLLEVDPERAIAIWQRIRADAANYVDGGCAVAEALSYETPWQRAQFYCIREALYNEWQPSAVERLLLDQIAHAHLAYLYWAGKVQEYGAARPSKSSTPSYQSTADALDQAMQMADRYNRLAVRTLRALRDLRRSGVVVVAHPGSQVNIGQQQVNVSKQ